MAKISHIKTTVLIIGGGLSGLTLAATLGEAGVDVVCIDRDPPVNQLMQKYDGRTTAISYASHKVLQTAGAWKKMLPDCEPILDIRVADGNSPFYLHFGSEKDGNEKYDSGRKAPPFGWIIENRLMRHVLFQNVKRLKKHVRHLAPAEIANFIREKESVGVVLKDGTKITAPLMIGADGRGSATREWLGIGVKKADYKQSAIVCNVAHELDHENVAVEHFLPAGPFAVLPMTKSASTKNIAGEHRSSIVWTEHGGDAAKILKLSSEDFDARLQKLFGPHLGAVHHVSKPMAYPLGLLHADTYIGERVALMAEAAHVIHPIAGQGLNLSMRDVAVLTELIVGHLRLGLDIGSGVLLKSYEAARRNDTLLMAGVTDILNRLFSNNLQTIRLTRDLGLGIVEKFPFLKRYFARQAMGLSGMSKGSRHKDRF
jgi:2-octaprenyl-6-methoxyphenol hydroxylase